MSEAIDKNDKKAVDRIVPAEGSRLKVKTKDADGRIKETVLKLSGKFYVNGG